MEFVEEGQLREDPSAAVIDERRRALVSALKSGRYPQTYGTLHQMPARLSGSDGGFCCLGVACEVAIGDGLGLYATPSSSGRVTYATLTDRSQSRLPEAARAWYGFPTPDPCLKVPQRLVEFNTRVAQYWAPDWTCVASGLNDDCRLTLPQIGECFQYTFLRDEWEAEHGAAASQ
jgi:hypothetical protein